VIGLTDVSPTVQAPELWKYDLCGQGPSQVGHGVTVHLIYELTCHRGESGSMNAPQRQVRCIDLGVTFTCDIIRCIYEVFPGVIIIYP